MTVKFITVKGSERLGRSPFYVGLVQHERTMSKRETYEYIAERTGYKATAIRAVFMAAAAFVRENQRKGNITYLDGVASIRNYVRGSFAGLAGPWVKGVNYLSVKAVEMDPFKTLLAAITPLNRTEGAKPTINTVLDETTLVYDTITGTDTFSIAGAGHYEGGRVRRARGRARRRDEGGDSLLRPPERQGASRKSASRRRIHAQGVHQERAGRPVRRARRFAEGGC